MEKIAEIVPAKDKRQKRKGVIKIVIFKCSYNEIRTKVDQPSSEVLVGCGLTSALPLACEYPHKHVYYCGQLHLISSSLCT